MSKSPSQKKRLLYLQKILLEQTDEQHGLTLQQLTDRLEQEGISCGRKSLYDDFQTLQEMGLPIESRKSRTVEYYVEDRLFALPELKLLVDAIQASRFVTQKKTEILIKKLGSLASTHQARQLQRQVHVTGRVKTENESIYYNVDALHKAISEGLQISFFYTEWAVDPGRRQPFYKRRRRAERRYQVSPWALTWNEENYYLIAYDSQEQKIKHFRVDKMEQIDQMEKKRDGQQAFDGFDVGAYNKKLFGMFGAREETVRISFSNHLAGVVVDRFGAELMVFQGESPERFTVNLPVLVSPQFFAWVFGLQGEAKILGPQWVRDAFRQQLEKTTSLLGEEL